MTVIISIVKIVVLLGVLILIHEAGHLTVAKLCKVKVNEFAIGFGPLIWSKQGKETKYSLRLIPLGGFCNMEGEEKKSDDKRSFSNASIPKRIAIVVAGATVNIIFGLAIYFILAFTSSNVYITNQIDSIMDGYVAQEIGLLQNDKIVEINGKKINNKYDIDEIMENVNGEEIEIKVERNDEILSYKVKPTEIYDDTTGITSYYIGVIFKEADKTFLNSLIYADIETKYYLSLVFENLKSIFTGGISLNQMVGPVGISEAVAKTDGFREFFNLFAVISLSLGITNLLPIPALDGGKIVILIIEAIRRKPLKEETEIKIQLLGFSLLIIISLYVTYNDVLRIV